MRIVTRPDFDGVVCAALLRQVFSASTPIVWTEPRVMQNRALAISNEDIIANLPWHSSCKLWFDHHISNKHDSKFEGVFQIAPSAAGLIYHYYKASFSNNQYKELIHETDRIDSANLNQEEILNPERNPWLLLAFTLSSSKNEEGYWEKLVELIRLKCVESILVDEEVAHKAKVFLFDSDQYRELLLSSTYKKSNVTITDFRQKNDIPKENRFLVFALYPDCSVNIKVFYDPSNADKVIMKVGHSIFNRTCKVNVGNLLKKYGGGGHVGAGSCTFSKKFEEQYINEISQALLS